MISIRHLDKIYPNGFQALRDVSLDIEAGEIFALLGPNGAGKTTLISVVCGIVRPTSGQVTVAGHDIIKDYKKARRLIGLVPQELTTDAFETVWNTVSFSRGLFGLPHDKDHLEKVLRDLSLWDKKDQKLMTLSGGMKRRVLIAKALAHEPCILFLDEPTAGVDVTLRKSMWEQVRALQRSGVTIILTTHYLEEAEEMADRVGIVQGGELLVVEEKKRLLRNLGVKKLCLELEAPLAVLPASLAAYGLRLIDDGRIVEYTYDAAKSDNGISALMQDLARANVPYRDLHTRESRLEEVFERILQSR